MGPPGVGKGTQAQRLAAACGVPVVATGDMFRKVRLENSPLATKVRECMDRGEYVPDELTIQMALDRLNQPDARKGFVLDGFPRTVPQAEALDRRFGAENRTIKCVVLLEAPAEVILARLTGRRVCGRCGRAFNSGANAPRTTGICDDCGGELARRTDESPEVQRKRLKVYQQQTAPVAAYYLRSGRLHAVDADRAVDEVQSDIRRLLSSGAVTA